MNENIKIQIAKDFSKTPGARFPEEGDFSGKEFRENLLLPKLQEAFKLNVKLEIDLDGTAGMGTSFLEEAFGGLIRYNQIDYNKLKETIVLISKSDPEYIREINIYMEEANAKK